jgi:NitT/TauT family transport system permease protein
LTSARVAGVRNYAWIVLVHLAFIAAWWLFVVVGKVPKFIMPTPLQTLQTLFMPHYDWLGNSIVTGEEIFLGYILAVIFGVALAVVCTWSRVLSTIFMPLLVSLNMIPKVALGPLFIVWFKYGVIPNGIIAFTICFFPILLTAARGLQEVEPELLDLVRSLHGSRWQLFTKIQLPGSLPYIFSGMKVGAVLAVAGAIVGEFLGSAKGLGYVMLQVQTTLDTAGMFMAVILITLIGLVLYAIVVGLEHLLVVRDARLQ